MDGGGGSGAVRQESKGGDVLYSQSTTAAFSRFTSLANSPVFEREVNAIASPAAHVTEDTERLPRPPSEAMRASHAMTSDTASMVGSHSDSKAGLMVTVGASPPPHRDSSVAARLNFAEVLSPLASDKHAHDSNPTKYGVGPRDPRLETSAPEERSTSHHLDHGPKENLACVDKPSASDHHLENEATDELPSGLDSEAPVVRLSTRPTDEVARLKDEVAARNAVLDTTIESDFRAMQTLNSRHHGRRTLLEPTSPVDLVGSLSKSLASESNHSAELDDSVTAHDSETTKVRDRERGATGSEKRGSCGMVDSREASEHLRCDNADPSLHRKELDSRSPLQRRRGALPAPPPPPRASTSSSPISDAAQIVDTPPTMGEGGATLAAERFADYQPPPPPPRPRRGAPPPPPTPSPHRSSPDEALGCQDAASAQREEGALAQADGPGAPVEEGSEPPVRLFASLVAPETEAVAKDDGRAEGGNAAPTRADLSAVLRGRLGSLSPSVERPLSLSRGHSRHRSVSHGLGMELTCQEDQGEGAIPSQSHSASPQQLVVHRTTSVLETTPTCSVTMDEDAAGVHHRSRVSLVEGPRQGEFDAGVAGPANGLAPVCHDKGQRVGDGHGDARPKAVAATGPDEWTSRDSRTVSFSQEALGHEMVHARLPRPTLLGPSAPLASSADAEHARLRDMETLDDFTGCGGAGGAFSRANSASGPGRWSDGSGLVLGRSELRAHSADAAMTSLSRFDAQETESGAPTTTRTTTDATQSVIRWGSRSMPATTTAGEQGWTLARVTGDAHGPLPHVHRAYARVSASCAHPSTTFEDETNLRQSCEGKEPAESARAFSASVAEALIPVGNGIEDRAGDAIMSARETAGLATGPHRPLLMRGLLSPQKANQGFCGADSENCEDRTAHDDNVNTPATRRVAQPRTADKPTRESSASPSPHAPVRRPVFEALFPVDEESDDSSEIGAMETQNVWVRGSDHIAATTADEGSFESVEDRFVEGHPSRVGDGESRGGVGQDWGAAFYRSDQQPDTDADVALIETQAALRDAQQTLEEKSTQISELASLAAALQTQLKESLERESHHQAQVAALTASLEHALMQHPRREEGPSTATAPFDALQHQQAMEALDSRWRSRYEVLAAELVAVKSTLAEQTAVLDRLGIHPPYDAALTGPASVIVASRVHQSTGDTTPTPETSLTGADAPSSTTRATPLQAMRVNAGVRDDRIGEPNAATTMTALRGPPVKSQRKKSLLSGGVSTVADLLRRRHHHGGKKNEKNETGALDDKEN